MGNRLPLVLLALALLVGALAWMLAGERAGPAATAPVARAAAAPAASLAPAPAPPEVSSTAAAPTPERAERRSDLVVTGEVVHAEDGAPFPGVGVRLVSFRETRADTTTDAQGRFELPWIDAKARAVEVDAPPGFAAHDQRQRLRGDEPPAPLRFELARDAGLPVAVRVVDAHDGAPLAELALEVQGPRAARRRATTDAEGVLRLDERWEPCEVTAAPLSARGIAEPSCAGSFAHGAGVGLPEVEVLMGPTVDLDLRLPAGCERASLSAWLEPEGWSSARELEERQPLHDGVPPWVRFTLGDLAFAGDVLPRRLVVGSHDGLWRGTAQLWLSAGRTPEPLTVALESRGVLRLRVLDGEGRARGELDSGLARVGHEAETLPGARVDGDVRLYEGLTPGAYEVSAFDARHLPARRRVEVEAGRATEVELRLEPRPDGGDVSGELRSTSGRGGFADWVYLQAREGTPGGFLTAEVRWTRGEEPPVGRFLFEDVPAGTWELRPEGAGSGEVWEPTELRVQPPASGLVLTLRDEGPRAWLRFEAVERGSGEPVPDPQLRIGLEFEGADRIGVLGSNRVDVGPRRTDIDLRWRLTAEGHLPASGTLADLAPLETGGDVPVLRARVELERGWEVTLLARHHAFGPIAGARVLADGVEVGTTDALGRLHLRRDAAPALLRVEADGWRSAELAGAASLLGSAEDWDGPALLSVDMRRP